MSTRNQKTSESNRTVRYERVPGTPLTPAQIRELEALRNRKVDTSDIPEWTDEMFRKGERGRFYRPVKEPVTVRIDSDVVFWLKSQGRGYQTRLNAHLREWMVSELKTTKKPAKPSRKPARTSAASR